MLPVHGWEWAAGVVAAVIGEWSTIMGNVEFGETGVAATWAGEEKAVGCIMNETGEPVLMDCGTVKDGAWLVMSQDGTIITGEDGEPLRLADAGAALQLDLLGFARDRVFVSLFYGDDEPAASARARDIMSGIIRTGVQADWSVVAGVYDDMLLGLARDGEREASTDWTHWDEEDPFPTPTSMNGGPADWDAVLSDGSEDEVRSLVCDAGTRYGAALGYACGLRMLIVDALLALHGKGKESFVFVPMPNTITDDDERDYGAPVRWANDVTRRALRLYGEEETVMEVLHLDEADPVEVMLRYLTRCQEEDAGKDGPRTAEELRAEAEGIIRILTVRGDIAGCDVPFHEFIPKELAPVMA